jgi:hypothetical protein
MYYDHIVGTMSNKAMSNKKISVKRVKQQRKRAYINDAPKAIYQLPL